MMKSKVEIEQIAGVVPDVHEAFRTSARLPRELKPPPDQGRDQAHGKWPVSHVVALLSALGVFAVIPSLCKERIGRPPAEAVWEGPTVACIAISDSVIARGDLPVVGRKR
jgi:hypothetical protein